MKGEISLYHPILKRQGLRSKKYYDICETMMRTQDNLQNTYPQSITSLVVDTLGQELVFGFLHDTSHLIET